MIYLGADPEKAYFSSWSEFIPKNAGSTQSKSAFTGQAIFVMEIGGEQ